MCLYVSWFVSAFVFPLDIAKNDADVITKLDIDMVHHESLKLIFLRSNTLRSRCTKTHLSVFRRNAIVLFAAVFYFYLCYVHMADAADCRYFHVWRF